MSSSDPVEDVCDAILAIVKWFAKEAKAVGQLFGDLVKALLSPGTYPIRWALWQAAMGAWDIVSTTHDILAHTGFMLPHGQLNYDGGELRWANEIDNGLIALGNSLDGSFAQALADAVIPSATWTTIRACSSRRTIRARSRTRSCRSAMSSCPPAA